jgi:predicted transcriptional regulator
MKIIVRKDGKTVAEHVHPELDGPDIVIDPVRDQLSVLWSTKTELVRQRPVPYKGGLC